MNHFKKICFCVLGFLTGGCVHFEKKGENFNLKYATTQKQKETNPKPAYTIEPSIPDSILLARQYAKRWMSAHELLGKLCPKANLSDLKATQPFSGYGLTTLVMRSELTDYMNFVHQGRTSTHTVKKCADKPTTRPAKSNKPCLKFEEKKEQIHTPAPLIQLNDTPYPEYACAIPLGMYVEKPITPPAKNSTDAKDPNYFQNKIIDLLKKRYAQNLTSVPVQRILSTPLAHFNESTILPDECATDEERRMLQERLDKVKTAHATLIQSIVTYMGLTRSAYLQAKLNKNESAITSDLLPTQPEQAGIKPRSGSGSQNGWYFDLWVSLTSTLNQKTYSKPYGYGRAEKIPDNKTYKCLNWGQPTTAKLKLLESVLSDFAKLVADHRKTDTE